MADDNLTRQDVESIVDQKLESLKNERMRNQRMINSLQEEVEDLKARVEGSSEDKTGHRQKIELEHKVMRAVAKEIKKSDKSIADPEQVKERVSEQGHLKSYAALKIDELIERDILIEQGSGDIVFMDPEMEDIDVIDSKYK